MKSIAEWTLWKGLVGYILSLGGDLSVVRDRGLKQNKKWYHEWWSVIYRKTDKRLKRDESYSKSSRP